LIYDVAPAGTCSPAHPCLPSDATYLPRLPHSQRPLVRCQAPLVACRDGGYPRRMMCAETYRLGLMAAWGRLVAIPLDIAARRGNTPVGCHSNTTRLMEEAERTPGVRVGYRPGSMGRQPPAGTHSHRGSHRHRVSSIPPSMAPNTAPIMARRRCRYQPGGLPTTRFHATRPATHTLVPRCPRVAPPG
jgi:hypothetical protein